MSDYLTIEYLNKVYLATFDARIKWRNILLMLEVFAATVETIGKEWSNNPDDCYREGLLEWLKGGDKSSYCGPHWHSQNHWRITVYPSYSREVRG